MAVSSEVQTQCHEWGTGIELVELPGVDMVLTHRDHGQYGKLSDRHRPRQVHTRIVRKLEPYANLAAPVRASLGGSAGMICFHIAQLDDAGSVGRRCHSPCAKMQR